MRSIAVCCSHGNYSQKCCVVCVREPPKMMRIRSFCLWTEIDFVVPEEIDFVIPEEKGLGQPVNHGRINEIDH